MSPVRVQLGVVAALVLVALAASAPADSPADTPADADQAVAAAAETGASIEEDVVKTAEGSGTKANKKRSQVRDSTSATQCWWAFPVVSNESCLLPVPAVVRRRQPAGAPAAVAGAVPRDRLPVAAGG